MNRTAAAHVAAVVGLAALMVASLATVGSATQFTPWGVAVNAESVPGTSPQLNTPSLDGCPFVSPDGRSLYLASDRPGGLGGIDIWVARRAHRGDPWGTPRSLGAPVNGTADDFCPSPTSGRRLFFVSTRPGGCGQADIYVTDRTSHGWSEPRNLGCKLNSAAAEAGPVLLQRGRTRLLYFSSTRPGGSAPEAPGAPPDADLYVSALGKHGRFSDPVLVAGVNTAANDARPHLRADGLELVFDSDRPGGLGGPDIWSSTRKSLRAPWSAPVSLGPNVNSAAAETRASFADHGRTLYLGSTRAGGEGATDIYVTTRQREHDAVAAADDRATGPAQLALARTLAREHYAYPAAADRPLPTAAQQASRPSTVPALLWAGVVGLAVVPALAATWRRGRARSRPGAAT